MTRRIYLQLRKPEGERKRDKKKRERDSLHRTLRRVGLNLDTQARRVSTFFVWRKLDRRVQCVNLGFLSESFFGALYLDVGSTKRVTASRVTFAEKPTILNADEFGEGDDYKPKGHETEWSNMKKKEHLLEKELLQNAR